MLRLVRVMRILRVLKVKFIYFKTFYEIILADFCFHYLLSQLVRHFAGLQSLLSTLRQAYKELGLLMILVSVSVLTLSRFVLPCCC